jgi:hypothetical protein
MSNCRKCGQPLKWGRRVFKGIEKWIPLNSDGSDHWGDSCSAGDKRWSKLTPSQVLAKCERILPVFWTVPDGKGSYRMLRSMPPTFGQQPEGELF